MSTQQQESDTAAFVLAGGQSSRMGSEKSLALFYGIPLIQNALSIFAGCGLQARIAGSRSDLSAFAEVIPDTYSNSGPLSGIHAALAASPAASSAAWNIFLPVDMPLMPPSLLMHLLNQARHTRSPVMVTQLASKIQPFPVVLHRSVLPLIQARLLNGETGCQSAWQSIPVQLGTQLNPQPVEALHLTGQCTHPSGFQPQWWFQSANTPAELAQLNEQAQSIL